MERSVLYDGIGRREIDDVLSCFGSYVKRYEQGETIASFPSSELSGARVISVASG